MRVCEINTEFTENREQADAIIAGCYQHYGHAGTKFAQYIVDNMPHSEVAALRQKKLEEYAAALAAAGCQSKTLHRLAEFGAILLTVADIAEKALGITFACNDITDFLVGQQINAAANTDIGVRAHNALRGFVNANIGSFITNGADVWTKNIPCLGKIEYPSGGGMEVNIIASEFPKIMKQLSFSNPGLILKKFKSAGLLIHEDKKNYRKRRVTKAGDAVAVNVIIFP